VISEHQQAESKLLMKGMAPDRIFQKHFEIDSWTKGHEEKRKASVQARANKHSQSCL
jgi:hypothetical protein